jgi:hypothetical protein
MFIRKKKLKESKSMFFNFNSFFKKQDDHLLDFIKYRARKEFLISFFVDFSAIASVIIFLISIISFATLNSINYLAKLFFPIFIILVIFSLLIKKIKFEDIAKRIDEKKSLKNILSTGLWLHNSNLKKNNYFTKILFDEIQIIIADLNGKNLEDILPRVFMPIFTIMFVLLISFFIANNFLEFQFDSVQAKSIKINEIKTDFKDVINSTMDNEMKIKIANDLQQKLTNQKYKNNNLINNNLKIVEKIKDYKIYSEVKQSLSDNNYDEAIYKLKTSINEIDNHNKNKLKKTEPFNPENKSMVAVNKNDLSFSPSLNKEALEDVIDALEENKDALDNEFEANQVGDRINEWVTTASQTDELTASRFGASIDTENVMPESGEGSSRIEGGTMFRQAAVAKDGDKSINGFEGGSASGDADADVLEGKIIGRAHTNLKRKNFTISNFSDDIDISDEWVYKPTTERILDEKDLKLPYSNVQAQKSIGLPKNKVNQSDGFKIKNYFLSINGD